MLFVNSIEPHPRPADSPELTAKDVVPAKLAGSKIRSSAINDDAELERLGKRPLLERNFGFMSILGFSCSALLSWEGVLATSVGGLLNGGTAGVIWGFLINWAGMISVYTVMSELASIAPTAAGQYHWVAMMAPKKWRAFLAYLTAWLTTTAWQAFAVSTGYLISTLMQGIIVLSQGDNPTYEPKPYQTVLILWAVTVFSVLINAHSGKALAMFEGLILVLHLAGFFGVLIPMVFFAHHNIQGVNDARTIFTAFLNTGGWSSTGLSFLVGFPQVAFSLVGADCAVHMSEEIKSASLVVPRAMMSTIMINGVLAFAMILGLLFSVEDLEAALEASEKLAYPFLQIFKASVQSTAGAVGMASVVLALGVSSSVGVYATASRIMWSFSRDQGLPLSKYLVRLTSSALPLNCVFVTLVLTVVLSLIALGSSVALNALLSLVNVALFSTYLLAAALLLWRRSTGAIQPYYYFGAEAATSCSEPGCVDDELHLTWGPWKLPDGLGVANNVLACVYSVFLLFWSFWPQYTPTEPVAMNWSVLIWGFVMLASVFWWCANARHYFKGPIREV